MRPGATLTDCPNFGVHLSDAVTSSPDLAGSVSRIVLEAARPNPFSRAAEVRFSLPSDSDLGVSIYDASGRLVRRLRDGIARVGSHVLVWDGRDDCGYEMPGGAYFYRIEVNDETQGSGRLLRVR